jgi:hypothetical protein
MMKIDGFPVPGPGFDGRRPNAPIKAPTAPPAAGTASQLDALVAAENRLAGIDLAGATDTDAILDRILGACDRPGRHGIGSLSIQA